MWYVYVLSLADKNLFIGITKDLDESMAEHAIGMHKETADQRPLICETYICVISKKKAESLKKYLQTKAGISFLKEQIL